MGLKRAAHNRGGYKQGPSLRSLLVTTHCVLLQLSESALKLWKCLPGNLFAGIKQTLQAVKKGDVTIELDYGNGERYETKQLGKGEGETLYPLRSRGTRNRE